MWRDDDLRRIVKLYDAVRTVHLERVRDDATTTILYVVRRYDFDDDVAAGLDLRRAGVLGAFWFSLVNDIDVLEVGEPLLLRAAPRTLAAIAGNRTRSALRRRRRAVVVTYAIENKDPMEASRSLPLRSRLKYALWWRMVRHVWADIDRIVFGTEGSMKLYEECFPISDGPEHTIIAAVPAAHPDIAWSTVSRAPVAIFLGDLSARKGFPLLVEAWAQVSSSLPDAHLHIVGKGSCESAARALAAGSQKVSVDIDPPRHRILSFLEQAKVLVLASQPTSSWREQVGLPIVEALSAGCEIVASTETGLAHWLASHQHAVLPSPTSVDALAEALIEALLRKRTPQDILETLPSMDGRRAADDWLLEEHRT